MLVHMGPNKHLFLPATAIPRHRHSQFLSPDAERHSATFPTSTTCELSISPNGR